ncbi:MAG: AbiJ-NTD4 domain-containing protein [Ramlibacter sp.]
MAKSFSQRMGIEPARPPLQVDSVNADLRNSIWNVLHQFYEYGAWTSVATNVAMHFTKTTIDSIDTENWYSCKLWVREVFEKLKWNRLYDLLEFLNHLHTKRMIAIDYHSGTKEVSGTDFRAVVNFVLEREASGYRFVGTEIAPITDATEMGAIQDGVSAAAGAGLRGAEEHIRASVRMLSLKPQPDYRNAVKEAISAVESVAKILAKNEKATLDEALKTISFKSDVHPALKGAFSKLYGYASDSDGVRHAITEAATVDFAEAKYMVVACSAFVYYLIEKGRTSGLL